MTSSTDPYQEHTFTGPKGDEVTLHGPEDYPDGWFVQIGAGDDMDWGNARLPMDEVQRLRDELTKVLDRGGR